MPLPKGLESVIGEYIPIIDPKTIAALFDIRTAITDIFQSNPKLLRKPYDYRQKSIWHQTKSGAKDRCSVPALEEPAGQNPIYMRLLSTGIDPKRTKAVKSFPEWTRAIWPEGSNEAQNIEGYALVDLSIYLVHLLNCYEPNRALLHNLYATNVQVDALRRKNVEPALEPIRKVMNRTYGTSRDYAFRDKPEHLLLLIERSLEMKRRPERSFDGLAFEQSCQTHLQAGGFEVRRTPRTGDYGADLIAEKDELTFAIQCKDTVKPIGVKAVQEAAAARAHYKADFGVVCGSGDYTPAAVELASSTGVILCNGDQLARRLDAI